MIGLSLITLSFVSQKRKATLILRALFSTRYLQQLLREGKLANERIYLNSILLYLFAFSSLLITFFQFYSQAHDVKYLLNPWLLYGIIFGVLALALLISGFLLKYFTIIFNYQEQRHLFATIKTLLRFYNALVLLTITSISWYAYIPELIAFVYLPVFAVLYLIIIIRFLRNISGVCRIHFFIYFCSLEILPYLLIAKLLIINF